MRPANSEACFRTRIATQSLSKASGRLLLGMGAEREFRTRFISVPGQVVKAMAYSAASRQRVSTRFSPLHPLLAFAPRRGFGLFGGFRRSSLNSRRNNSLIPMEPAYSARTNTHLQPFIFLIEYSQFCTVVNHECFLGFFQRPIVNRSIARYHDRSAAITGLIQGRSQACAQDHNPNAEGYD